MIVLWIFLALLAFILLLLLFVIFVGWIGFSITANGDGAKIAISFCGIRLIKVDTSADDTPKVRVSDYTLKKVEQRRRKKLREEYKKKLKKAAEPPEEETAKPKEKKGPGVLYIVKFVFNVLKIYATRYLKHLKIKMARLHITVATGDPASTAVLYGAVIQSANYLIELMDHITSLSSIKRCDISIRPDFLAESTSVDIKIKIRLRVLHVVRLLLDTGIGSIFNFLGSF